MYAINLYNFGHLKETDSYTTNKKHGNLYQLFDNQWVCLPVYLKEFLDRILP